MSKLVRVDAPDTTMTLKFFVCWDCDGRHLNSHFAVQDDFGFDRKLKCPRYPSHQHVELIGYGESSIKWIKPEINVFVD